MSINDITLNPNLMAEFGKIFGNYGLDIARYKPAFIKRRLDRRMRILNILDYSQYADVLQADRQEFEEIFASLSINVTNFFRDSMVFDRFQLSVLPKLVSGRTNNKIRIWSAGCASGEEPYSIAMMLRQIIGDSGKITAEVIANDVNKSAIQFAERGRYSAKSVGSLPSNVVQNNFHKVKNDQNIDEYEIIQDLKDMITFRVGDILSDGVKSFDAIFCRNVLIYYEKEAQELILGKFHNSLQDSGYLILGMDETMFGRKCQKLFNPIMLRERIYQKISKTNQLNCDC